MKLYFEMYSGISGDMIIGALLDLGASRQKLIDAIDSLGLEGYKLRFDRVIKNTISAYKFKVEVGEEMEQHLTFAKKKMIKKQVKAQVPKFFCRLTQMNTIIVALVIIKAEKLALVIIIMIMTTTTTTITVMRIVIVLSLIMIAYIVIFTMRICNIIFKMR